jgi:hypothetical protein
MGVRAIVRFLSVVIHDLDVRRAALSIRPFKANSPLHVDANAVLALSVALQAFERIRGQCPKISEARGRFENVEALFRLALDALEVPDAPTFREVPGPFVAVASDHAPGSIARCTLYVKEGLIKLLDGRFLGRSPALAGDIGV